MEFKEWWKKHGYDKTFNEAEKDLVRLGWSARKHQEIMERIAFNLKGCKERE